MTLRLIFMGTPDFAVPTLAEIVKRGHEIAAVFTRAPKPAGRGMAPAPSPVAVAAVRLDLPVLTPESLRLPEAEAAFQTHRADAAVVVRESLQRAIEQIDKGDPRRALRRDGEDPDRGGDRDRPADRGLLQPQAKEMVGVLAELVVKLRERNGEGGYERGKAHLEEVHAETEHADDHR